MRLNRSKCLEIFQDLSVEHLGLLCTRFRNISPFLHWGLLIGDESEHTYVCLYLELSENIIFKIAVLSLVFLAICFHTYLNLKQNTCSIVFKSSYEVWVLSSSRFWHCWNLTQCDYTSKGILFDVNFKLNYVGYFSVSFILCNWDLFEINKFWIKLNYS